MKRIFALLMLAMGVFSCQQDEPSLSSDKNITEFGFLMSDNPGLTSDVSGVINGTEIHCIFPAGTSVTALKPLISHKGETINPASGTAADFSGLVEYTVTAKDRSEKKYTVSVTVLPPALSSDKSITSFSFLKEDNAFLPGDVTGTISGQNIHLTVPAGTDVTALKPTIVHTGSTTNPTSNAANNFTSPRNYTVTAEDGSSEIYNVTVNVSASGPIVYVVGGQRFYGTSYARLWTNGTGSNLTNGTYNAAATSVFVSENTIHAAGYQTIGNSRATSWKLQDGIQQATPGLNETVNDAYTNSIFVSAENDVYIAGQENHGAGTGIIAKVWKNGSPTALTTQTGAANSVFVAGNDVYVAGWESTATGTVAKVWKNGVPTALNADDESGQARAVFVVDDVVYVAGQKAIGPAYVVHVWKNGVPEIINAGTTGSEVSSIFVSDGDVYLVGREIKDGQYYARLWHNGVGTFLSTSMNSDARSVYVHNGDVYVAGWEYDAADKQVAVLWKNGVATPLATDAFAYGVMVK